MAGIILLKQELTPEEALKDLINQILSRLATIILEVPSFEEDEYEKTKYSIYKMIFPALEMTFNNAVSSLLDARSILVEWEKLFFIQDKFACRALSSDIADCLALIYDIKDIIKSQ